MMTDQPVTLRFVDNLNVIYEMMYTHQEVVLYPVGIEGQNMIELLRYSGRISKLCCIAVPKLANEKARQLMHSVPMLQVDNLPHMRDTALFIVVAPKQQGEAVCVYLHQFGCKNIIMVGQNAINAINAELQNFYKSGQSMGWFLNYFYGKLWEFKLCLEK